MDTVKKQFFWLILYLALFLPISFAVLAVEGQAYSDWLTSFSLLVLLAGILQAIFFHIRKIRLLSLSGLFLLMTYFFHFGQILLCGLLRGYTFQGFNFLTVVDPSVFQKSSTFCLLATLCVGGGMMLSRPNLSSQANAGTEGEPIRPFLQKQVNLHSVGRYLITGWIFVLFFFPLRLASDLSSVRTAMQYGYLSTFQEIGTGAGIISVVSDFCWIGFALLILGYATCRKQRAFCIFLFVNLYLVFAMLSGGRGHQIITMCLFLYLEHHCIYPVRFRSIFWIALAGYFLAAFLNVIQDIRSEGIQPSSSFLPLFINSITDENPVLGLIEEMGGSAYTPYLVYQQVPQSLPYGYGLPYLKGLVTALPNIGGMFTEWIQEANFVKQLNTSAIGGSFIGELYYNFSYGGLMVAALIGYLVQKLSMFMERKIHEGKIFWVAALTPAFRYILWLPRDCFYSLFRPVVWGAVALWAISLLAEAMLLRWNIKTVPCKFIKSKRAWTK